MEEFEKRIQIHDNRILLYRIFPGYSKDTYTITEYFLENGEVLKTYSLSQWDDYGLNGWTCDDEEVHHLSFEFDMNHPLFFSFFHLLNYDDELIIDDDDTRDEYKRYLRVHRDKDRIFMDFIDEVDDSIYLSERFYVFIKNILHDGRSKIDRDYKDTKLRLVDFFKEVHIVLTEMYHQISLEEWFLRKHHGEEDEHMKRVFKRRYTL